MEKQQIQKSVIWFVTIAFTWTWGWVFITAQAGGLGTLPPLGMFGPMIAALIVQKVIAKKPILGKEGLGFIVGKKRFWLLGPGLMVLTLAIVYGVTYLAAPNLFVDSATLLIDLADANIPLGGTVVTAVLTLFGLNLLLGPILNIPLMLGEEVGWRAFLTPNLVPLYGKRGLIVGNLVWAFWHMPMIFQGLNYGDNPWLGMLFMLPLYVSLGIIFQAIYQRSAGSVWVVALMHGVLNQGSMTITSFFMRDALFNPFVHGPTGLIGLLVMGLLTLYLYQRYEVSDQETIAADLAHQHQAIVTD